MMKFKKGDYLIYVQNEHHPFEKVQLLEIGKDYYEFLDLNKKLKFKKRIEKCCKTYKLEEMEVKVEHLTKLSIVPNNYKLISENFTVNFISWEIGNTILMIIYVPSNERYSYVKTHTLDYFFKIDKSLPKDDYSKHFFNNENNELSLKNDLEKFRTINQLFDLLDSNDFAYKKEDFLLV